jgi:hypothetical protein
MFGLELLEVIECDECPSQMKGHHCKSFAVAVVLHPEEGKEVHNQTSIVWLWNILSRN